MTDKPSFEDLAASGAHLERKAQDWHITAFVRVNVLPAEAAAFGFDLWRFVPTFDTRPTAFWQLQVTASGHWRFVWNAATTPWSINPLLVGAVYELSAGWDRTVLACTLAQQGTKDWEQQQTFLKKRPPVILGQPMPVLDLHIQDYAVFDRALSPEDVRRLFSAAQMDTGKDT